MKKIMILIMLFFTVLTVKAQILKPVKWAYAAKQINDKEAVLLIKATIDDGWHIYSSKQKDGGPVKTSFNFAKSPDYLLAGTIIEPKAETKFEKVFKMNVSYFAKAVVFEQKIKLKSRAVTVKGVLNFMGCNDHQCLPPENLNFEIPIK